MAWIVACDLLRMFHANRTGLKDNDNLAEAQMLSLEGVYKMDKTVGNIKLNANQRTALLSLKASQRQARVNVHQQNSNKNFGELLRSELSPLANANNRHNISGANLDND